EAQDLAAVAHAASLRSRVPFLHFFDGFRTSHEIGGVETLDDDDLRALIDEELIVDHRLRSLDPQRPVLRGSAQNPDVFFQAREAANPYYLDAPDVVEAEMTRFAELTGRRYHPFEYYGADDAEQVLVIMGSGAGAAREAVAAMAAAGEKVGVVVVRLYRPFDVDRFCAALPSTTRRVKVLDRTKEPGAPGEPLYLDVVTALSQGWAGAKGLPRVTGGRFGLSSKEFTPAMVKAVFADEGDPRRHFT